MIYRFFIALYLLLIGLSLEAQEGEFIFHEVKAGETKYGISRQYGVTIEQLEKFNPEIKSELKEGVTLLIPKDQPEAESELSRTDSGYVYHQVKAGDTFFSLSQTYGVSIAEIKEANPQLQDVLRLGERIKIPLRPQAREEDLSNYYVHKIIAGETAYSLSRKYRLSLDSLYLLNPEAENGLGVGQLLKLPLSRAPQKKEKIVEVLPDTASKPRDGFDSDEDGFTEEEKDTAINEDGDLGNYFLYKVKTGDSFYSLKNRYGVSQSKLLELNPELSQGLTVGRYIIIPKKKKEEKELSWLEKILSGEKKQEERQKTDTISIDSLIIPQKTLEKPVTPAIIADTLKIDIDKDYRVGLMLPFYTSLFTDTVFENEVEERSKIALDFYNGFLMAADTLGKQGMNISLNVFDTRNDMFRLRELIPQVRQNRFDLVVGPLYSSNVQFVADQLAEDYVPVISPLSTSVEVKGQPNLIKCITGKKGRIKKIADLLNEKYSKGRIIFAHSGKDEELEEIKQIKARLQARERGSFIDNVTSFTDEMLHHSDLKEALDTGQYNVIILVSEDKIFLSDLVNKLRVLRDTSILLIGSPRLMRIPTLEVTYLDYLNLTMPDMNYIDYSNRETIGFIESYRQRYADEPGRFAFQGYDVGLYFLERLWKRGLFFTQSLESDTTEMLSTGFEVRKTQEGGYENNFLYVTAIRDMKLVRLQYQEDKSPSSPPRK